MLPGATMPSGKGNRSTTSNVIELWSNDFNKVFEQVFDCSLIGMAVLDCNGKFLRVNKKACEIWEYEEEELMEKTWEDITYKEDLKKSTYYTESYKGKSKSYSIVLEKRYVTGYGNIKSCKITTSPIRDENGKVIYFVTQIEDITQKKAAMDSIREGRDFIKKLKSKSGL